MSVLTRSLSLGSLSMTDEAHSLKKETLERLNSRECKRVLRNWLLADVDPKPAPKLPLSSFNHIAREVLNLEKSRHFYCDILGFNIVPRPHFECEGYWLFGYGLSLHLVETSDRASRKIVLQSRIKHFSGFLPRVDHIAFITSDLSAIQKILDNANVYYKRDSPSTTGIEQIFFFDPDGNVIEVSNCAPPVGEISCSKDQQDSSRTESISSDSSESH